mmetsp:Transcript_2849/g.8612  ORF Transcript_2849/g.8612 Transcript_2849/m.8612 type:complete len:381 (-) Transcript_2849:16-1158(-)
MRPAREACLALCALAATAANAPEPSLRAALDAYADVHETELAKFARGEPHRVVRVRVSRSGLGNRVQSLLSAFALALATRSALVFSWPEHACDWGSVLNGTTCEADAFDDLYEPPPFARAVDRVRKAPRVLAVGETRGFEAWLARTDLDALVSRHNIIDVHTDHHFLLAVLCNAGVRAKRLFPRDALETQRVLEAYLLAPSSRVRRVAAAAAAEAGGCAVGVHLRSQKSKGDYSDVIAANAYATIRVLLSRAAGGLFVASDGHSEWLRERLHRLAQEQGVPVVARGGFGGQAGGDVAALAENRVLSACSIIVPSRRSSFFRLAAVRAAARDDVRTVWACPATRNQTKVLGWAPDKPREGCTLYPSCPGPRDRSGLETFTY